MFITEVVSDFTFCYVILESTLPLSKSKMRKWWCVHKGCCLLMPETSVHTSTHCRHPHPHQTHTHTTAASNSSLVVSTSFRQPSCWRPHPSLLVTSRCYSSTVDFLQEYGDISSFLCCAWFQEYSNGILHWTSVSSRTFSKKWLL